LLTTTPLPSKREIRDAFLAEHGITEPEYAVFCILHVLSGQPQTRIDGDTAWSPLGEQMAIVYGDLDLTWAGAQLYQSVAQDVLGIDWDTGLHLEQSDYHAERWYTQTEQGIWDKVEELHQGEEVIISCRVSKIGPWCLRWWQRFPSGYLLEVELGKRASRKLNR
jgi:hypothetical protein